MTELSGQGTLLHSGGFSNWGPFIWPLYFAPQLDHMMLIQKRSSLTKIGHCKTYSPKIEMVVHDFSHFKTWWKHVRPQNVQYTWPRWVHESFQSYSIVHSNRVLADTTYRMLFFYFHQKLDLVSRFLGFYFLAKEAESQDDIKGNEFALKHLHE